MIDSGEELANSQPQSGDIRDIELALLESSATTFSEAKHTPLVFIHSSLVSSHCA
jgi:hypothetical protein